MIRANRGVAVEEKEEMEKGQTREMSREEVRPEDGGKEEDKERGKKGETKDMKSKVEVRIR